MNLFPIVIEINIDPAYDTRYLFRLDPQTRQVVLDIWIKRMNALLESGSPEALRQVNDSEAAY